MSQQTYAGERLVDPNSALESCLRLNLPTDWRSLAPNQWAYGLGIQSGHGAVLLTRASLDRIDLSASHDLRLALGTGEALGAAEGHSYVVTHKSLHVVLARNVTPGLREDENACYLVELADRRRLLRPKPLNKRYNVRSTTGAATFFSATRNAGSDWTWQTMVTDLWTDAGITDSSTLPFTPHGTPEGFDFCGHYALDALQVVFDRIGCALRLETQTDAFSIVRVGSDDTTADSAERSVDKWRVLDSEFLDSPLSRYPASVRVFFPKSRVSPDSTGASPFYTEDATDPSGTPTGVSSGTYAVIYDDLPANYDSGGSITNAAALTARTAERAADYFRRARMDRKSRLYGLPLSDEGLRPGSQTFALRHSDRGAGLVTHAAAWPGAVGGAPFVGMVGAGAATAGGSACCDPAGDSFSGGGSAGDNVSSIWHQGDTHNVWIGGGSITTATILQNPTQFISYLMNHLSATSWPGLTVCGDLRLCDTDDSHFLTIAAGSNLTANRTLTLTTGDADRSVTIPADGTLAISTGISGGQTISGGTAASNSLTLQGTTHATPGTVDLTASTAATTGVVEVSTTRLSTTGTAGDTLGVSHGFYLEDDGGTLDRVGAIDAAFTDSGAGSEDVDFIVRTMRGGTVTEQGRFTSTGALRLGEVSAPGTPASGFGYLYFDTSGDLHAVDDAGNDSTLSAAPLITLVDSEVGFSAVASISLTGLTGYKWYRIVGYDLQASTGGTGLWLRTSTDGGSTYDSGGSDYTSLGSSAAQIALGTIPADSGTDCINFDLLLYNPAGTVVKKQVGGTTARTDTGAVSAVGGCRAAAADVDAVQFLTSGGGNFKGTVLVYGFN